MKLLKRFIQAHSVGVYLLLAFAIPWLVCFLLVTPKFFQGESIELLEFMLMGLAMYAGPVLSGILVAFIVDGKHGISDIFGRMKIWRVGRWYFILLIFPVFILSVSFLLYAMVSLEFAPVFLFGNIMMGVAAGFLEEVGWMGFAFPRMREKHGLIRVSVYLGLIHGLWHFPVWFLIQYTDLGSYWLPYFIAFVIFLVALRVIMVWAYSHTSSLLLLQLIHASSTGFLAVLTPEYSKPVNWVIFYSVYAVLLWVVALIAIHNMAGFSNNNLRKIL